MWEIKDFFEIEKKMYPLKIWPGGSARQREAASGSARIFLKRKKSVLCFVLFSQGIAFPPSCPLLRISGEVLLSKKRVRILRPNSRKSRFSRALELLWLESIETQYRTHSFFGSGETLHLYGNATLVQNASVNFFLMERSWNHPRCLPAASPGIIFQSQIPRFVRPGLRMKAAPHAANVVIRKVRSYRMISGTYVAFRGVVICPDLHIFCKKNRYSKYRLVLWNPCPIRREQAALQL